MDIKNSKIDLLLLFITLGIFPLGQLPRLVATFAGINMPLQLIDVAVLLIFGYSLWRGRINILSPSFVVILTSSLFYSLNFAGWTYLIRLIIYLNFFGFLLVLVKSGVVKKNLVVNLLIAVTSFVGIFGIIQYLVFPDLRTLYAIGWDDHYMRLTSTFLDPAFTGIILTIGIIALISKKKINYILLATLGVSLLLTYSRSSLLCLTISSIYYYRVNITKYLKLLVVVILFASLFFISIPNKQGEGVNLARTSTITFKVSDYQSTLSIFAQNPVFGIGFNNICDWKIGNLGIDKHSHSCGGADNSLLLILATTGVIGFISFLFFIGKIIVNTSKDKYGEIFFTSGIAVLVHSQFTNTLFYPWVLVLLGMLYAVSRARE